MVRHCHGHHLLLWDKEEDREGGEKGRREGDEVHIDGGANFVRELLVQDVTG